MGTDNRIAIKVSSVSKSFVLPHEKKSSLKSFYVNVFKRKQKPKKIQVLKDVSFNIKKGEFFGVAGRNGSGKSTLLKLIAGIYHPDQGKIEVDGKIAPFIELGVGFNPELTGRENVFLNGALLGFTRKEIHKMYEEIVEFAELEQFMHQKLKNYSSGMQVRLAFSISIRAKSPILLLDEVLAVGDESFQKKCMSYFYNIKNEKQTVVLVTHDMTYVERFCDRALVLDKGKLLGVYKPLVAKRIYEKLNRDTSKPTKNKTKIDNRWGTMQNSFKKVSLIGGEENILETGESFAIEFETKSKAKSDEKVVIGIAIEDELGAVMTGPNSRLITLRVNQKARYEVPVNVLNKGTYTVRAVLFDENVITEYDHIQKALEIEVIDGKNQESVYGKVNMLGRWTIK